jgi:hypothetical protein
LYGTAAADALLEPSALLMLAVSVPGIGWLPLYAALMLQDSWPFAGSVRLGQVASLLFRVKGGRDGGLTVTTGSCSRRNCPAVSCTTRLPVSTYVSCWLRVRL